MNFKDYKTNLIMRSYVEIFGDFFPIVRSSIFIAFGAMFTHTRTDLMDKINLAKAARCRG